MSKLPPVAPPRWRSSSRAPAGSPAPAAGRVVSLALCAVLPAFAAVSVIPAGPALAAGPASRQGPDHLTYHGTPQRTGWYDDERRLRPRTVGSTRFGLLWESPQLDPASGAPPRLFASPLYVERVPVAGDAAVAGLRPVVYVASTTGYAYAINAFRSRGVAPGTILWRTRLTEAPCSRGTQGVLSTPVIDRDAQTIFIVACDSALAWRVHALDLRDGRERTGWPLPLDAAAINRPGVNANGANRFPAGVANLQRGALNLSPDRSRLYVTFGGEPVSGWLLAIDTRRPRVASAFSMTATTEEGVGGLWGSGGASVDARGDVYVASGSSVVNALAGKGIAGVFPDSDGNWGQSIVRLALDADAGFRLVGSYTPWNYCQVGSNDVDLGSGAPVLFDLDPAATATPQLLALGGNKQGNAYLLDREHLPGGLRRRQPCGDQPARDGSLLAPEAQSQFGGRGPLNVFGPYSDRYGMGNQAKSRSTGAYFRDHAGRSLLFVTGSQKAAADSGISVAPGLARLHVVTQPGQPAFLRLDQVQPDLVLQNPGSPVVTSHRRRDAIVWVLDPDKPRSATLYGADAPQPVLYAVDAATFALLWRSPPGQLHTSGKYNEPVIARGTVFVGTDRLQAFGLWPRGQAPAPFTAHGRRARPAGRRRGAATDAALAQGRVLTSRAAHPATTRGAAKSRRAPRCRSIPSRSSSRRWHSGRCRAPCSASTTRNCRRSRAGSPAAKRTASGGDATL